jgi:ribosomal protein S18 acetylase RimI-like enzyme
MSEPRASLLSAERPELGTAALLPWDTEHFGFPVGTWTVPAAGLCGVAPAAIAEAVSEWAARTGSRLVSASVQGTDLVSVYALQAAGFRMVDYALAVRLPGLHAARFTLPGLAVREAEAADHAGVIRIAAEAFSFGRYHTDPWFPQTLANRRYARWLSAALTGNKLEDRVLVTGPPGEPSGFLFARLAPPVAELLLAGVAPEYHGGPTGVGLYVGSLLALRDRGARLATSVVSAANNAVMNLYASLGFRFGSPTVVLHRYTSSLGSDLVPSGILASKG